MTLQIAILQAGYACAAQYAREQSKKFAVAVLFLPPERRRIMQVAYSFFRTADNLVDIERISPAAFDEWVARSQRPLAEQTEPLFAAWAEVCEKHQVDRQLVQDLLNGIRADLLPHTYQTWAEVCHYAYQVAATVGLLSLPLLAANSAALATAAPYARQMCIALQLTNILKDLAEDLRAGRCYLPQQELAHYGLSVAEITAQAEAGVCDARVKRFLQAFIAFNRQQYAAAWPGLRLLSWQGRAMVSVGVILYQDLLSAVERRDYQLFAQPLSQSTFRKMWLLLRQGPAIWRGLSNK